MKTLQTALTMSVQAAADLERARFIGFNGNYCGADAKALGVSQAATKSGQQCPVDTYALALVEAAGAITQGAKVYSDASGKATATGTNNPNGYAVDAAGAAGDLIRVLLT